MAVTETTYTGNGSKTNYSFTFPYLKTTDIKASINGTATTAFTLANATTVQFNTAPANSAAIRIYRETDDSKLEATFFAGSAIKSSDLNDNFNQNLYVTQESNNKIDAAWTTGDETIISTETWVSNDNRVSTTAAQDGRIDSKIDTALTTDIVGGQSITITDNSPGTGQITASVTAGSIRGTELAADAVDGTKIADDSIDSEHYVDGSIDTQHIANAQVTHDKLANDCIDGDNIQNDVINSEHYAAGSIDTEHIADSQVTTVKIADLNVTTDKIAADAITGAKIANDQIDSEHLVADSIDSEHYAPNSVDTNALAADAVTGAQVADNAIDSEHYVDGSVDHVHLANDCIDGDNIQDDVINSEHYAAGSIDTEHIADSQVTTAKIAADAIDGTKIADNAIGSEHIAANAVGDSEIATGALDGRYYTKATSDARYFNISTGDTIKDGDTFPDNDTTIATTAAINDRIIDLVDDVGGFVPIANETSFPNANPDVNNGTGTLVSIKTLASNLTSNGSGVATIANGTVGNSTVTINGLENSTTYSSGYGMIVETTTTLNTYTFHRLVPKATEVTTVAGKATEIGRLGTAAAVEDLGILGTADVVADLAILGTADVVADLNTLGTSDVVSDMNTLAVTSVVNNMDTCATNVSNINTVGGSISNVNTVASNMSTVNDFAARYRVASSDPSSNNDEGDLVFNTTSNELRVYNGSQWQGGVTATGNLASLGANTFTGAQTFISSQTFDGRDLSVDGAKLDGIEAGATADQTNAEIRAAVEAASDSNVFTDADHSKLNAIEANATADQTNAEIRAAVEAASDSNVFTDADHSKLNAIEAGATADQTAADIRGLGFFDTSNDGSGSGLDADTVDGIHASSFVRTDASSSINTSTERKLWFAGSSNPFIEFAEGTTNKAYIQWNSNGYLKLGNYEDSSTLLLRDDLSFSLDGTNYNTVWHAGNDGAGSGLDADLLDGVHGASFLRSDADDSYAGNLTINGLVFANTSNNNRNLKIKAGASGDVGISLYDGSNNWRCQLYGASNAYGFLDGNWTSWDIKKVPSGNFEVDEGSGLKRVLNVGNVGSGGALSSSSVYLNELYASGWVRFSLGDTGLYHSGNGNYLYSDNATEWSLAYNGSGGGLNIRDGHNGTVRGYFYANDSNQIGILDNGGSWSLRTDRDGGSGSGTCYLYDQHFVSDTNGTYSLGTSSLKWNQVHANSFHGDGSNLTNLPPGGNTISLTASGSIATNKPVTLNSDGTCSAIATATTARTVPYHAGQNNWRNNKVGSIRLAIDSHFSKMLIGFSPNGGTGDSQLQIACTALTNNPSSWTYTYGLGEYQRDYHRTRTKIVHDPDRDVNLYFYGQNYGGTGEIRILQCNSSNNSVSYGSSTNFTSTASYPNFEADYMSGCYDTNANNSVIAWCSATDSDKLKCRVVNLSGASGTNASVSLGTTVTVSTNQCRLTEMLFDPDTNKVVLTYHKYASSIWQACCVIGTVSGTSISFGSEVVLDSSNEITGMSSCYDTTNNKVVVGYYKSDRIFAARVGTVSGTSISFGTELDNISSSAVDSGTKYPQLQEGYRWCSSMAFEPESGSVVLGYKEGKASFHKFAYVSGTSLVLRSSSATSVGISDTTSQDSINLPGHDRTMTIFSNWTNNAGASRVIDTAEVNTNCTSPNHYLGFAQSAVSNGQTATILTYGNTTSNLSGLTTGTYYFVQGDGTLSTSHDNTYFGSFAKTPVAGLALSSSKLLINNSMPSLNSEDGHSH